MGMSSSAISERSNMIPEDASNTSLPTKSDIAQIRIDTSLYTIEAIFRACYKFTDRCFLFLERADADTVVVQFRARAERSDLAETVGAFQNELIDQHLRAEIARQTRDIRNWIVAQAFVEADLDLPHTTVTGN
jgi:His-Xaa-Ser system protein HxsD